jgi:GMP synthase (glutamine-hydrolysing)
VQLARSDMYPNQAFRFGKRAYGLQFHIEMDRPVWRTWSAQLPLHEGDHDKLRESHPRRREILRRFAALAVGAPV